MAVKSTGSTSAPKRRPDQRFRAAIIPGLRSAVILGTAAGLLETALLLPRMVLRFEDPDPLPMRFILGAAGRIVATHFLFWLVAGGICSAPIAVWISRRPQDRPLRHPQTIYFPLFVFLIFAVIVPPDLDLRQPPGPLQVIAGIAAGGLFAATSCLLILWVRDRRRFRPLHAAWRIGPWACAALALLSAVFMYRSPFRGPGSIHRSKSVTNAPATAGHPPNFLWIVLGSVRADRMSCYGYDRPTTPFLNSWAARSVVYDRAISSSFWSVPAHASMFTGLPVRRHGATHDNVWLADEHFTMAELLGELGYLTFMCSNNPDVSRKRNLSQGFVHVLPVSKFVGLEQFSLSTWPRWLGIRPPLPWLEWDHGAASTNAYLEDFVDRRIAGESDKERPWFLFVNYMDAHLPYAAPNRFRKTFMSSRDVRRSYALEWRAYGDLDSWMSLQFNMLGPQHVPKRDRRILADLYDASLAYLDARVDELIGLFEERGLLRNTVVIITSDHGEALGEQGQWGHHHGVRNSLVHVPLMIHYPGPSDGRRVAYPVQIADLFPTVAALAGRPVPPFSIHNAQNLNDISELAVQERVVVAECLVPDLFPLLWAKAENPNSRNDPYRRRLRAAFYGDHKYVQASDGHHELYDLRTDPDELQNRIEEDPGLAGRLSLRLRTWAHDLLEFRVPPNEKKPALSPYLIEQLRSLGYLK